MALNIGRQSIESVPTVCAIFHRCGPGSRSVHKRSPETILLSSVRVAVHIWGTCAPIFRCAEVIFAHLSRAEQLCTGLPHFGGLRRCRAHPISLEGQLRVAEPAFSLPCRKSPPPRR